MSQSCCARLTSAWTSPHPSAKGHWKPLRSLAPVPVGRSRRADSLTTRRCLWVSVSVSFALALALALSVCRVRARARSLTISLSLSLLLAEDKAAAQCTV